MSCSKCIFHDVKPVYLTTGNSKSKDILSNYCMKLGDPDVFAINQAEALIKYKTVFFMGLYLKSLLL